MYKFLFFSLIILNQNLTTLFDEGNSFYNNGNYEQAIEKYSSIIKSGYESSELYYNLGNSYYKLNDIANSIFYFEKSLLLDPNNLESKNNLSFANNMTIDRIETVPVNQIAKFISNLSTLFKYQQWFYFALFIELISVLFFVLYLFNKNSNTKRKYFSISISFFILFSIVLAISFNSKSISDKYNPAIIFENRIAFKTEPNERSEQILELNKGTKVNIIEDVNEWSLVELSNGSKGWVLKSSFQPIK
jgi:tetratricopeptide (TPR) repeat protein